MGTIDEVGEHRPVERPLRIVIADDHLEYRAGLVRAIGRHRGLELVGEAADGVELLELLRDTAADLALVDVRMPRLGGLDACRRLQGPDAPAVYLLTGGDTTTLTTPACDAGAAGLLSKDLARDEICARLAAGSSPGGPPLV
jgi:DNA-binding NarL/FixJ family response regulator